MSEPKRVGRRTFLNYAIAVVATGVIVGAATYFAVPKGVTTVTAPGTTTTIERTVTTTITGTPTTSPTTSTKPYEGVKLNVCAQPFPFYEAMEPLLPKFKEMTGIDVSIIYYPEEDRRAKIMMDASTGTGAFQVYHTDEAITPGLADAGLLVPLKDYYPPEYDIDDFVKAYIGVESWKGVVYGCPFRGGTDMLYYRKDLFEAEKYPVPDTMDELREAAKHFTRPPDLYGIALRGKRGFGMNCWLWQEYAAAFGGKYFEDTTPVFNSPECVEATKFYIELIQKYSPPGGTTYTWSEMLDSFMAGKVAMLTCDWDFLLYVEDPKKSVVAGKVGYAPFPRGPAGRVGNCGAHGLSISAPGCRTEKERKAAALFIAWITSKEMEKYRLTTPAYLQIARKSTIESPEFLKAVGPHPDWVKALTEMLEVASPKMPRMSQWPQIGDYLGAVLEELFTGQRTDVKASLDEAVDYARKVLAGK
jgi:multiple sugar transport system substrate-binding protein